MAKNFSVNIISDIENMTSHKDFYHILSKHIKARNIKYIFYFAKYWKYIPDEYFYDLYKEIMCDVKRNDYFKELFGLNIEKRIKSFNKNDTTYNTYLKEKLDENGYLTIYRGHTDYILRNTASWTLNKNFAHWFGKRYAILNSQNGYYVYTAKVSLKDIFTYLNDKNEEEIVVTAKHLKSRKKEYFEFKNPLVK